MPDTDHVKELQQDLTLGNRVSITLTTGKEIEGILESISLSFIGIKNDAGEAEKYRLQMVGGWKTIIGEAVGKEENQIVQSENADQQQAVPLEQDAKQNTKAIEEKETEQTSSPEVPTVEDLSSGQKEESKPVTNIQPELERQLWRIEVVFEEKIKQVSLPVKEPEFPQKFGNGLQNRDFQLQWHRIVEKYRYARSVNELNRKFGRLTEIIQQLKRLRKGFSTISGISPRIAYLLFLQGQAREAISELQREAVLFPENLDDFTLLNSAAISLQADSVYYALYFLTLFFKKNSTSHDAWYVFLGLLISTENLGLFLHVAVPQNEADWKLLMHSVAYALLQKKKKMEAVQFVQAGFDNETIAARLQEVLPTTLSSEYMDACRYFSEQLIAPDNGILQKTQAVTFIGTIVKFGTNRGFGFIRPLVGGGDLFFHISAVVDEELRSSLYAWPKAASYKVQFKHGVGPTGDTVAIELKVSRSPEELYELSRNYADKGDYINAIGYIKQLLKKDPGNTKALEQQEKLKRYTIGQHLPKGANPYARAKRAELVEQDLEAAVGLYRKAINTDDNRESAVKDLAMLLPRLSRTDEAVKLLEQYRPKAIDKARIDNLLIMLYEKTGDVEQLQKFLIVTKEQRKKELLLLKIGSLYLKTDCFKEAEETYRQILTLSPENLGAKKNLAYALFRQDRIDEAEQLLSTTLDQSLDNSVAALLQTIQQAQYSGEEIDLSLIELELTSDTSFISTSGAVSEFMRFFLNKQSLTSLVPAERIKEGRYYAIDEKDIDYDLRMANKYAVEFRAKRPQARAEYYLMAAKIIFETEGDLQQLYKFMYRAFVSLGDDSIENDLPLDTVRQFYQEAVTLYGRLTSTVKPEREVQNAVVRFLWSTLGTKAVIPMNAGRMPSISSAVEDLITKHPEPIKIFDFLAPLIFSCEFAERQILGKIFPNHTFRNAALTYFSRHNLLLPKETMTKKAFIERWSQLKKMYWEQHRHILTVLRTLRNIELTRLWLDDNLHKIKKIVENLQLIELDRTRIQRLASILNMCLTVLDAGSYEIQAHRINDARHESKTLMAEIETSPTRLSIEEIHPILVKMLSKLDDYENDLYNKSKPQIELRLPLDFDTLTPQDLALEVQIVIENKKGRSPAENVSLQIKQEQANPLFYAENRRYPYLKDVLRGGSQDIMLLPVKLTTRAIEAKAFSFTVHAEYKTVRGELQTTQAQTFQINLGSREKFIEIDNPYEVGSVVQKPEMVYGRDDLIKTIVSDLQKVKDAVTGQSFVIYGQKRTGKSTILYYLGKELLKDPDNIVVDIGNIGETLEEGDNVYHRFRWKILSKFRLAIRRLNQSGLPELDIDFPKNNETFLSLKSPAATFTDIFDSFIEQKNDLQEWRDKRVIVLIDEFTYFFKWIREGKISEELLKNWKAFLQANYFNAVLVGQDFMPKFIKEYENEFAAMKVSKVTYLQKEDAELLLDEPIRIGGRNGQSRYRENAVQRILDLTAGSPFYIQMFCKKLVEYLNSKKSPLITEAYVEDVKTQLIESVELGTFENLYNSEDSSDGAISAQESLMVLKQIAENSKTGPCPRHAILADTSVPVDNILTALLERDVLKKDRDRENYYQIKVSLFRDFLLTKGI